MHKIIDRIFNSLSIFILPNYSSENTGRIFVYRECRVFSMNRFIDVYNIYSYRLGNDIKAVINFNLELEIRIVLIIEFSSRYDVSSSIDLERNRVYDSVCQLGIFRILYIKVSNNTRFRIFYNFELFLAYSRDFINIADIDSYICRIFKIRLIDIVNYHSKQIFMFRCFIIEYSIGRNNAILVNLN